LISLLAGGVLLLAERDEAFQALDAVGRAGIVLDIARSEIFRRRVEILLVQRLVVELEHGLLVGFRIGVSRQCPTTSKASTRTRRFMAISFASPSMLA